MTERTIKKVLITQEDLALGQGDVVQTRQGTSKTLKAIDLPWVLTDSADLRLLDTAKYKHVQLQRDGSTYDYHYSASGTGADDDWNVITPAVGTGRWLLTSTGVVHSVASLQALTGIVSGQSVYLSAGGRSGYFAWDTSNLSAEVTADTAQGVYIAPTSATTGASGAWVRDLNGFVTPEMFGAIGDFNRSDETGTDDHTALQAAAVMHTRLKTKLICTKEYLSSAEINISGWCDIDVIGCIFGSGTGRGIIRAINEYENVGSFIGLSTTRYPASTGTNVTYVDAPSLNGVVANDVVMIKDSTLNAYSTTTSPLAEIATVGLRGGSGLYLDCNILRQSSYSNGDVYLLNKDNKCSIKGEIYGSRSVVRSSAVSVLGYVNPQINLKCHQQSSSALLIHSCLGGDYFADVKYLANQLSNNQLGYGVIAYGACKGGNVEVLADNVRHAYTDGVYGSSDIESGAACFMTVTGKCYSSTSASWDTHPDSDYTTFNNIEAWNSHSDSLQPDNGQTYALQLRSSNTTVNGLQTNKDRCIFIRELQHVDSIDYINNVIHKGELIGAVGGTNRKYGIVYAGFGSPNNPISQTASVEYQFSNCQLSTIEYQTIIDADFYTNCVFDWSQTTLSWPSFGSGEKHTFKYCEIKNPVNLQLSNTDYVLEYTKIITDGSSFSLQDGSKLTAINCTLSALGASTSFSSFAYTSIASGSVEFTYSNLTIEDDRSEYSVRPFDDNSTGGTVTVKDITVTHERKGFTTRGDSDLTIEVGAIESIIRQSASLTADRTYTLSTVSAKVGDTFDIVRTSGGVFNLDVGGLKNLATNTWCRVGYDGSVWRLVAYGAL